MSGGSECRAEAARRVALGDWDGAVAVLTEEFERSGDVACAAEALALRHRAFAAHEPGSPPQGRPAPVADVFPGEAIPEVDAADLGARVVASALQHHGALLVRGLVDAERAAELRNGIDAAFAGAARYRADPTTDTFPDLVPFVPDEDYEFGPYERAFADFGGGVLGVDSPSTIALMIDALRRARVDELLADYFGERAGFSVKKTTLRRTEPDSVAGWHQDGAFLGVDTRALNIWTALSPCGRDAPGLDVFPRAFRELVPTGGPQIYDWSVSDETASAYGTHDVVRPEFDTGDALVFDHMTLHRTGVDPSMTRTRYAIEMWFFAASTYPVEQIPILL